MCWLSTSYERKTLPHLAILPPRPLVRPEQVDCDPFSMCRRYRAASAERKTPGQRLSAVGQLPGRARPRHSQGWGFPNVVMPRSGRG
jgi:hypothetical protein